MCTRWRGRWIDVRTSSEAVDPKLRTGRALPQERIIRIAEQGVEEPTHLLALSTIMEWRSIHECLYRLSERKMSVQHVMWEALVTSTSILLLSLHCNSRIDCSDKEIQDPHMYIQGDVGGESMCDELRRQLIPNLPSGHALAQERAILAELGIGSNLSTCIIHKLINHEAASARGDIACKNVAIRIMVRCTDLHRR